MSGLALPNSQLYLVDLQARKRYTYKKDPVGQDRWRSHHKEVLANAHWEDDCDSLASTVANLLMMEGQPANKLWFAHVDTNDRDEIPLDHMIAFAECREGKLWVIGDTFGPRYPAETMKHQLVKACNLKNILAWFHCHDVRQLTMM